MKTKYIYLLLCMLFSSIYNIHADNIVMKKMCQRLFPQHATSFSFSLFQDSVSLDRFSIENVSDKILIKGNSNNSLAVGLNYYLRNYCHVHVSWYASKVVDMPDELPKLDSVISVRTSCKNRFFLNYCTFGYSMPYWKWNDWERLIDWMALNGITMPLAITGQEGVWYNVWRKLGLDDKTIRSYFTGPAHLPWHWMANVDHWQGPLTNSWIKDQTVLQKKILQREREFSMNPVLPAFSGHVPFKLKELFPDARIYKMSQWGGFDNNYRSYFIDPMDSLFNVIQCSFLEEQEKIYGTNHIYGIDPFNEVDLPNWSEKFLANVSSKIYESIHSVDPLAKWVQMTWMFYYDKEKWTQPRIRAFLNAVPDDNLLLLDYYCDDREVWRETQAYYNKPYIWCYLGNFGGNTMLAGNLDDVDEKIQRLFVEGGNNVSGIGATLEGLDVNSIMYEYVFAKAWNTKLTASDWVKTWALCRGGNKDKHIVNAWTILYENIYKYKATCGQAVLMNARPVLEEVEGWCTCPDFLYDNTCLWKVWSELLDASEVSKNDYLFDVVNIGRQVLGNLFSVFRDEFTSNYRKGDMKGAQEWAFKMDSLLLDTDRLLLCEKELSIGKWIYDARQMGETDWEKDCYENNARTILTVWGQKATQLNDYGNRGWGGLTKSFYRERWKRFTNKVLSSMAEGIRFDSVEFYQQITKFEEEWTFQQDFFLQKSKEDPLIVAKELFTKYRSYVK